MNVLRARAKAPTDQNPERKGQSHSGLRRVGLAAGGLLIAAAGTYLSSLGAEVLIDNAAARMQELAETPGSIGETSPTYWAIGKAEAMGAAMAITVGSLVAGASLIYRSITDRWPANPLR